MPRINIHEVDNTKPGTRAYSNYSVVVPGFHAPYVTVQDENLCDEINAIILQKDIEVVEDNPPQSKENCSNGRYRYFWRYWCY